MKRRPRLNHLSVFDVTLALQVEWIFQWVIEGPLVVLVGRMAPSCSAIFMLKMERQR